MKWQMPRLTYFACPQAKNLRKTLIVITEFSKGSVKRITHDNLSLNKHKFVQVYRDLYALSFGRPMIVTKYANAHDPSIMVKT